MPFKCKSSYNYSFPSFVIHTVSRETMDDNGRVGYEKESINYTDPKYVNTPKCNVMDMEALVNAGQKIQRVNTMVLNDVDSISFAPDVEPPSPTPDDKPTQ